MLFDPGCPNCGCPAAASPCGFPLANLTVSYVRTTTPTGGPTVAGSAPLVYIGPIATGPVTHRWLTGLVEIVPPPFAVRVRIMLECWRTGPFVPLDPGPYVSVLNEDGATVSCQLANYPRTTWTVDPSFAEYIRTNGPACRFLQFTVTP